MKGKMIITYKDVTEKDAIFFVQEVMEAGRVSRNDTTFCCASKFGTNGKEIVVLADKTKGGTDIFEVYKEVTE